MLRRGPDVPFRESARRSHCVRVPTNPNTLSHSPLLRFAFSAATSVQRAAYRARGGTRPPKKPAGGAKSVGN